MWLRMARFGMPARRSSLETELIRRCCDHDVKLLWSASDNPPDRYIKRWGGGGSASWFFHLCIAPRSGSSAGTTLVGNVWVPAGTLRQRRGSTNLQWDRASDETKREKEVGTFSLGLSEVCAAEFSRMGRSFDCPLAVGAKLLSTAAGAGQGAPRSGARVGV